MRQKKNKGSGWVPFWLGLFPLVTTLCFFAGFQVGALRTRPSRDTQLYREVRDMLLENYVEPLDARTLLYSSLSGMVGSLDKHSAFYPPKEAKAIQEETEGSYEGIGIVTAPYAPPVTVLFPIHGGPAERAGIAPGDRILKVNGILLSKIPRSERTKKLRGPVGSKVILEVERGKDKRFKVSIKREKILVSSVRKSRILDEKHGIGYIYITQFQSHTVHDFDVAWAKLKADGARYLILDLRFNRGGNLGQAVLLLNRFVKKENVPIVSVIGRVKNTTHTYYTKRKNCFFPGDPLIVLVNETSASASEVFAGAVQDLCLGVLVGTRTFGKGTVQTLSNLSDPSLKVKFTVAHYATPALFLVEPPRKEAEMGARGGIVPDFPVYITKKKEQEIYDWVTEYDPPEKYREKVKKLCKELGIKEVRPPEDPQLNTAVSIIKQGKAFLRPALKKEK